MTTIKNRVSKLEANAGGSDNSIKMIVRNSVDTSLNETPHSIFIPKTGERFVASHPPSSSVVLRKAYIACARAYGLNRADPDKLSAFERALLAATKSTRAAHEFWQCENEKVAYSTNPSGDC